MERGSDHDASISFVYTTDPIYELSLSHQISSYRFIELVPASILEDMPLSIYKYQDQQEAAFQVQLLMSSCTDDGDDDDEGCNRCLLMGAGSLRPRL